MSLLAPTLLAAVPAARPPTQDEELLSFWIADLETFFADPKDAGMLRALKLIDDRVLELPGELPGFQIPVPPEVLRLGLHLLTGEKSLRIGMSPELQPPFYGQLELMESDAEHAGSIAKMLLDLARSAGAPLGEPTESGLVPLEGAPVPIVFGARGDGVILSAGKVIDDPIDLSGHGLPAGVQPSLTGHLSLGGLFEMGLMMAGSDPEMDMLSDMFDGLGLLDFEIMAAYGTDDSRSYTVMRMPRYAGNMRASGLMPTRGLTSSDVAMIPKDAVWASLGTANFQGSLDFFVDMFEPMLAEEGMGDPIEMLAGMTGFHIENDLIAHLGDTVGLYTSDTTGGGGLLSAVAFVELRSPDGMLDTVERLQDIVNGMAEVEADGYVDARSWEFDGTSYITLTFPGLPVPAEPTIAFTNRHMIVGLTASSTVAAVGQAKGEGPSLLDNARFRENLPASIEGAYSVAFFDSPRMIQDGYGLTNLVMSALTNGTRSRSDATRDAGVIMPSYHALMDGAKASVSVTRVIGDDLVTEQRGDRSVVVNLTSAVGLVVNTPILAAIPGVLLFAQSGRMLDTPEPFFMEDF